MPAERKRRRPGRRRRIGYVAKKRSKPSSTIQDKSYLESPDILEPPYSHEFYESDRYFKTCLEEVDKESTNDPDEVEYYVILDRVYRHNPEDDLDMLREWRYLTKYGKLKLTCMRGLPEYAGFSCLQTSKFIRYFDVYDENARAIPVMKTCVTVDHNFNISVNVHGRNLPSEHPLYSEIPCVTRSVNQLKWVLECVSQYKICPGNNDSIYQDLPIAAFLDDAKEGSCAGYRENVNGSTIRSTKCDLLIKTNRCFCCTTYRRTLTKSKFRQKDRVAPSQIDWIKSTKGNIRLSEEEKLEKLKQMKMKITSLESEVDKLRRQVTKRTLQPQDDNTPLPKHPRVSVG